MRAVGLLTMPDVLFIKTSSLGDVIHHMPALMEARRQRPAARFCWVVEEAFAPLVQIHPAVSDVIPVASRRWRGTPLTPATWREIAWKSCLLEGLKESRAQKKPVLLWVFIDRPIDDARC